MSAAVVSSVGFPPQVAQTGTFTSPDIRNVVASGVKVVLDMTAAGSGSVVLTIQGKDPGSGNYYTLLAGAAVASITTKVYTVHPSIPVVANVSAANVLPEVWRVTVSGNGSPTTFTVGATMVP